MVPKAHPECNVEAILKQVLELGQWLTSAAVAGTAAHHVERHLFEQMLAMGAKLLGEFFASVGPGDLGQTVTLEGPTAAQLERGFDLANWDVEPGVYAVAQEDTGEVLHVTTQTLVPQEQDAAAHEITLGTIYAFEGGEFSGYAYYLDRREEESDRVTRTYVRPGRESYRVSYEAPATATSPGGDRNGAFVPLLVGWRGFEDARITRKEGE